MESAERAYYTALFQRDFKEAQRLYREVACSDTWTPDRMVREAHKCGLYDEAEHDSCELLIESVSQNSSAHERKG